MNCSKKLTPGYPAKPVNKLIKSNQHQLISVKPFAVMDITFNYQISLYP